MTDYFAYGPQKRIEDFDEASAIAIFGAPIYYAWRETLGMKHPTETLKVAVRVKSVNRTDRTITVEVDTQLDKSFRP